MDDDPHERQPLTFSLFKDKAGEWRWHLRSPNNKIIASSGEGYANWQDATHAIEIIQDESADALTLFDPPDTDPRQYATEPPFAEMDDG
jgi:uncharacterized protein YegP (UPF0339 family)